VGTGFLTGVKLGGSDRDRGVFNRVVGSLWYGPLFGKIWLRVIGKTRDEIQGSGTMYILPLLSGLVAAYALATVIGGLGLSGWRHGVLARMVLYLSIGEAATLTVGTFEDSPKGAWLIYTAYQLLVFGAQGSCSSYGSSCSGVRSADLGRWCLPFQGEV